MTAPTPESNDPGPNLQHELVWIQKDLEDLRYSNSASMAMAFNTQLQSVAVLAGDVTMRTRSWGPIEHGKVAVFYMSDKRASIVLSAAGVRKMRHDCVLDEETAEPSLDTHHTPKQMVELRYALMRSTLSKDLAELTLHEYRSKAPYDSDFDITQTIHAVDAVA